MCKKSAKNQKYTFYQKRKEPRNIVFLGFLVSLEGFEPPTYANELGILGDALKSLHHRPQWLKFQHIATLHNLTFLNIS